MAQLGARLHGMQKVWGSSPHGSISPLIRESVSTDHSAAISGRMFFTPEFPGPIGPRTIAI